ncbi:MAG: hypothetical protein ABI895_32595 [Deltaproteobacteria bacterium]
MATHKLTTEYSERLDRFAVTFPFAHEFLKRLEVGGPRAGLWLSTAVNAHLYKEHAFIAYIKLKNPELSPPSLVLSPRFHLRIVATAIDESRRLFPGVFDAVLAEHSTKPGTWATRHAGGVTELGTDTPRRFFASLYERLIAL